MVCGQVTRRRQVGMADRGHSIACHAVTPPAIKYSRRAAQESDQNAFNIDAKCESQVRLQVEVLPGGTLLVLP
jgi:hypothetical protein